MRYLSILADDLTGAADTAARCRQVGLPATIFLGVPEPPLPPGVLAFTSDSRHLPAEDATQRVRIAAASLRALNAQWYKKIDSTLRGHIGSELDALLDLLDAPAAIVCPAFPAQERGLRNGYLVAPDLALTAVHLPSLLREQSRYPVVALSLEDVRSGELAARMQQADAGRDAHRRTGSPPERRVLVVDALTDGDLDTILKGQAEALPDALLCGSAGLAGAFAQRAGEREDFPSAQAARRASAWQSALLFVGSGSAAAHRQIAYLCRSDLPVSRLTVTPDTDPAATACLDPAQPIWLLQQPPPQPGAILEGAEARRRAEHLAQIGATLFAQRPPDLLILVGGDTAAQALSRLGVERLSVERELLPGMPLCRASIDKRPVRHERPSATPVNPDVAGGNAELLIVMKPGSFGGPETLVELLASVGTAVVRDR